MQPARSGNPSKGPAFWFWTCAVLIAVVFLAHACSEQRASRRATVLRVPPTSAYRSSEVVAPTTQAQTTPTTAAPVSTGGPVINDVGAVLANPIRTPGATNPDVTQDNINSTICTTGWTATVRPSPSYTAALKDEQLATGCAYQGNTQPSDYQEDHLIPLQLGGSPDSTLNLWPEPYAGAYGAKAKDQLERTLNSLVCDGTLSLAAAQRAIATNWYDAYETDVAYLTPISPSEQATQLEEQS
jgi:hypothetical protein